MPSTDVLVIGAGPAGSIAALTLARAGLRATLVEAKRFPRDKVCGDGLIPDSIALLRQVGLLAEVEAIGHRATGARMFAPSGRSVSMRAPFLTVRRERLDALLVEAATRAGAKLREGVSIAGPVREDGAVVGARGRTDAGADVEFRAPITILATGAASGVLDAFGMRVRSQPSALALRGYYRVPDLDERELVFSYEKPVMPGYGWVFPMGGGTANVGVGVFLADGKTGANLKELFERFTTTCAHVRDLMRGAEPLGPVRGAPLRCNLEGARTCGAGLLVAGEAIGTTYGFTGEGIGKAMESGRLAARVAAGCLARGCTDARALAAYPRALAAARFPDKFRRYRSAQRWMTWPLVANLIAWRASRSAAVRDILEGVIREERSPDELLSVTGMLRALVS